MKYDFVEIGTSDFATEIQKCGGRIGLSVDPIQEYIDRLPSPPTAKKVCAAITTIDGSATVYYVPDHFIKELDLPPWMKGCACVGKPHPTVTSWLRKNGHPTSLISVRSVRAMSIRSLFEENDVTEIDFLKIDTEGHDFMILSALVQHCETTGMPLPLRVKIEALNQKAREEIGCLLVDSGYDISCTRSDIHATLIR